MSPDKYKLTYKQQRDLLNELRRVYRRNDEREFMKILRQNGIKDEDPRFSEILQFFRALSSGKA
jgi:hypothetical protein